MLFGDDNYMGGCHRMDVAEGNGVFIMVNDFGGYFAGYYLTKNTIHFSSINLPFGIVYLSHPLRFLLGNPIPFILAKVGKDFIPFPLIRGWGNGFKRGATPLLDSPY